MSFNTEKNCSSIYWHAKVRIKFLTLIPPSPPLHYQPPGGTQSTEWSLHWIQNPQSRQNLDLLQNLKLQVDHDLLQTQELKLAHSLLQTQDLQ